MIKNKKRISLLFISLLLLLTSFTNVYALEDVEHYTPQYKEYLKLSDEEKAKVEVIPDKYGISLDEYNSTHKKSSKKNRKVLPSRFNLADTYNIKVENQGSEGNCWIFASVESIETYIQIHEDTTFDFSEMHVNYLESNLFEDTMASRNINTGGNYGYFVDYMKKKYGTALESDFPYYDENGKVTSYSKEELPNLVNITPVAYASTFINFPFLDKENNTYTEEELTEYRNNVKEHIMTNGSLYTTIIAPDRYTNVNYNPITYAAYFPSSSSDYLDNSHAVSIIGWDDNYSKDNFVEGNRPAHDGAYIALNSWGTNFGDYGLYYISYDDVYVEQNLNGVLEAATNPENLTKKTKITFNDNNLYKKIKKELKRKIFDYDDNTKTLTILNQNMQEIFELDLANANISDLSGVEKFTSLTSIDLSNNNISSISNLITLHDLDSLNLSHNNFTSIPDELDYASLSVLDLSYNPIEDFSGLEDIVKVEVLNVEGTNFSNQDLSYLDNKHLISLDATKTNVNDLTNLDASELGTIILGYNENINYSSIPNIYFINLNHTSTTEADIALIPNTSELTTIDISYTNVHDLSCIPNTVLTFVMNGQKNLEHLEKLNGAIRVYNEDAELDDISIFKDLNIGYLKLTNNNISSYHDIIDENNFLILDLADNNLTELEYSEHINLRADNNFVKPDPANEYFLESAYNQRYEETIKLDDNRDNLFYTIGEYLTMLDGAGYDLEIENATLDTKNMTLTVTNEDEDVVVTINHGKFEGSTITYKIQKIDSSNMNDIFLDITGLRKTYIEGDNFDRNEIKVYAAYDNQTMTLIDDYEVIGGENLQAGNNEITIKKGNFERQFYINAADQSKIKTLTFENKAIYDAALKVFRQREKERQEYPEYYDRTYIIISNDDDNKTITIFEEDLIEINSVEIISDDIGSLEDLRQLTDLRSLTINSKNFTDIDSLEILIEIMRAAGNQGLPGITITNNEALTSITNDMFRYVSIKDSNITDINSLKNVETVYYTGNKDLEMEELLDTVGVVNVNITKKYDEVTKDENGNLVLPHIYKTLYDKGYRLEAKVYDQIRDTEFLNPFNIYTIDLTDNGDNIIIELDKLKEIDYDGTKQTIEIKAKNINESDSYFDYVYTIKYQLFEGLELISDTPIEIEEDSVIDLSNYKVYKVYSNQEKIESNLFDYDNTPIKKGTTSIEITVSEDGTTSKISIPVTVVDHNHTWSDWTIIKESTTSEPGLKERTCLKNSSHKETVVIDKVTPKDNTKPSSNTNNTTPSNDNKEKKNDSKKEEKKDNTKKESDSNKKSTKKEEIIDVEEVEEIGFKYYYIIIPAIVVTGIIIWIIVAKRRKKVDKENTNY